MAAHVAPEVTARLRLEELLRVALEPDEHADVHFGPPGDDAGSRNVWVGGIDDAEDHHGARGDAGASIRQRFVAHLHVDLEDDGADLREISTECWDIVGRVRQAVRDAARHSRLNFGDVFQAPPKVVRTSSDGPMPLAGGGGTEHVVVDVQFVTQI